MSSALDTGDMSSYLYISMRNEIRTLRTARDLSQQQLAEAMDVSRQTINSIEKERYTPSLPLAIALARYFRTTVEEMFHVDDA
jgi:putative transcriptional regulator